MRVMLFWCVIAVSAGGCAPVHHWHTPAGHAADPHAEGVVAYTPPPNVLASINEPINAHNPSGSVADDGSGDDAHSNHPHHSGEPGGGATYPLDHCIVTGVQLGSMGEPVIYPYEGLEVRFCCRGCVSTFEANPEAYLGPLREAMKERDHLHHEGEDE